MRHICTYLSKHDTPSRVIAALIVPIAHVIPKLSQKWSFCCLNHATVKGVQGTVMYKDYKYNKCDLFPKLLVTPKNK